MPNYNISLNDELALVVDTEIKTRKYSSRSEFFRDLVRQRYVTDEDQCASEVLPPEDPDAAFIQSRKKDASFIRARAYSPENIVDSFDTSISNRKESKAA